MAGGNRMTPTYHATPSTASAASVPESYQATALTTRVATRNRP